MLTYKDKPLEELTLMECYEFEKELLDKLSKAARSQFSNQILEQINSYIELVRFRKVEILERERMGVDQPDYANKQKALNIGDEPEQTDDIE